MLEINSLMIGSKNAKRLADFYTQIFERDADMIDGDFYGWRAGSTFLSIGPHSELKNKATDPNRILINLETKEVKKEFERISKIEGARIVKDPYVMEGYPDFWIATLEAPDGNYFQLMAPWE